MKTPKLSFPKLEQAVIFEKDDRAGTVRCFLYDRETKAPLSWGRSIRNLNDPPNTKIGKAIAARRALKALEGKQREFFYGGPQDGQQYCPSFPEYGKRA